MAACGGEYSQHVLILDFLILSQQTLNGCKAVKTAESEPSSRRQRSRFSCSLCYFYNKKLDTKHTSDMRYIGKE